MPHVLPVYSIAKPYTAAAAFRLLDLDASVGDYVPGLRMDLGSCAVCDLLTHRAGIGDYGAWSDYRAAVARRSDAWTPERILARAEMHEAGQFNYSNIGYLLVRLALEQVHGGTYFDVINNVILTPLGIAAGPFATRRDWDQCTHPAVTDDLRAYDPAWVYTGTFCADPAETARGLALMLGGALGASLASAQRTSYRVSIPTEHPMAPTAGYGLGVMTTGDPVEIVAHGGQGPEFTLFAAARVDGTAWHAEAVPGETNEAPLIERCLVELRAGSDVPMG